MRAVVERDPQVTRMVGISAAVHAILLVLALVVLPALHPMPLPIVAYTVELTDPSALGGRLPPGPADKPLGARPGSEASADATTRLGVPDAPPAPATPPPVTEHPTSALRRPYRWPKIPRDSRQSPPGWLDWHL